MLALVLAVSTAHANADLTTSIATPAAYVYASGRYTVTVANGGSRDAANVSVSIQLPRTNTSPTVHPMGTVGSMSSGCSRSGTVITCNVGSLRKGRSTSVWFDMTVPEVAATVTFSATASTTSTERSTTNNGSSAAATLSNYVVSFAAPATIDNRHCTGTNLTSFFECELYPSSISGFSAILEADGSVSIPDEPGYSGSWVVTGDELSIVYIDPIGDVAAEFVGYGVSAGCWEGLTTFPGSTYVSPYETCLR